MRDLRVEAVSITASATVWLCHHHTHLSFINSGQAHAALPYLDPRVPAVEAHLRLASTRLLLDLNKDYIFTSLVLQLMKWCQLRE